MTNVNNTDITVNMENLTPEERETLTKLMVKANQPVQQTSKVFRPEKGDDYFVISSVGKEICYTFDGGIFDLNALEVGNCYRTEQEAEQALKRQKAKTKYLNFLRDNEPVDWKPKFNRCIASYYLTLVNSDVLKDFNYSVQSQPLEFYSDEDTIYKALNTPEIVEAFKTYMGVNN